MALRHETGKDILLIPVQDNLSHIGLKYLHYTLLENGWQSKILYLPYLNLNNSGKLKYLQEFIAQMNPLYIGLSLTSLEYNRACELSNILKKYFPAIPVIWGGVHPTIDPDSCFPFADYVCVGEGEKSILDFSNALINGQEMKEVPNLCYRENGQVQKNALSPAIKDLDSVPWGDHIARQSFIQRSDGKIYVLDSHIFRKEARFQGKVYELMSSRGCAFSCTYCCNNFFSKMYPENRKVRRRSIENIITELENAVRNNPEINTILFHDDSFLICSIEYLSDFCKAYKAKIKTPLVVRVTPTSINADKLRLLKDAGLSWITMGLQTGSDRVNREVYKRRALKKDYLQAAHLISKFQLAGKYDVILDNPFEMENDIIETVETLIQTPKPYLIDFFSLTLFPGTELYERVMTECPEKMDDCRHKNYMKFKDTILNKLVVLAVYVPETLMSKLLRLYKSNSNGSIAFKITYLISQILSSIYYKPKTYLNMLKRSRGNSYVDAIRVIPMYIKDYVTTRNF